MKRVISTALALPVQGTSAQAVQVGNLLFVSGQLPIDPETGEQYVGTLRRQVDRVVWNLQALCAAANATLEDVAAVTVYVADLGHLIEIEDALQEYFAHSPPARSLFEVSRLPGDAGIMMDAVVSLNELSA